MPVQLDLFPESLIALNQETLYHPDLQSSLSLQDSFEEKIAKICTYCDVMVDGAYSPQDMDKLYDILFRKLFEKRSILVLS